jgi:SEC-C motif
VDADAERAVGAGTMVTTLAWFPAGDYEDAVERWPSLAEDWADCRHDEYCRRIQWELLRLSAHGVPMRGVAPIRLADYLRWCDAEKLEPESSATRARYAVELTRQGEAIPWPPGRNDACWCGSRRKYKHCCATVSYAPGEDS